MVKKNIITFQVSHIVIQHRMLRAIKKTSTDIDLLKMSIVSCAIGPDQPNLKNLIITIDTSIVYNATKVCLKFFRNNWPGTMMSEPFYL